jgi:predicted NBD/HSP70 family sugar kinase
MASMIKEGSNTTTGSPADLAGARSARPTNPATVGQVLRLIREDVATTRGQIGHQTGLSRTAVASRVAVLIDAGLVVEVEVGTSNVGRPPTRLALNAGAGVVLSASIGRSRTQAAVCDLAGEVIAMQDVVQNTGLGPDQLMPKVVDAFTALLAQSGTSVTRVRGIGLSIPGSVDAERVCSRDAPMMTGWDGVPLTPYLNDLSTAHVSLDSDTNVMALSERRGQLAGFQDALIVKASTGFGASIVAGGVVQRGAVGAAGDLGHIKTAPARGLSCRCGDIGCLEAVAGGWALVRDMRARGREVTHIREVVELALAGDSEARQGIRESGRRLGEVLAAGINLLNPAAVVVGGDMAFAYDTFVAGLRETLYRNAGAVATRDLQILSTTHADWSGVRGCAVLALDSVFSEAAVDATTG